MDKYNKDIHNCKCDNCKKGMRRKPYEIRSGKGLYCSRECNNESKSKKAYNEMCEKVECDFREWLNQKYNVEKLNSRDLAELAYGKRKNGPNITNWMKKLDVPIRKRSDAVALQWVNNDERKKNAAKKAIESMGAESLGRKKLIELMQTDEYKIKISISNGGKNNGMYGMTGEKSSRWNPNLTDEERMETRKYPEYSTWRKKVFERDSYTCQRCKYKKGGTLNAHHINGYHWDKNSRTEVDNGITLCNDCHKGFHEIYGYGDNDLFQFSQYMNEVKV